MTRKEGLLGLAPLDREPVSNGNGDLQLFDSQRALTKEEQRTVDEFRSQMRVIEAINAKTSFGMAKIAELHEHAAVEFDDTVGYILRIKDQPRGKEHQLYINEFTSHQVNALARHLMGAVEVGATAIGAEIHRPLYFAPEPPPPPKRRSLREALWG